MPGWARVGQGHDRGRLHYRVQKPDAHSESYRSSTTVERDHEPFNLVRVLAHLIFGQDVASPLAATVFAGDPPASNGTAVTRQSDPHLLRVLVNDRRESAGAR